MKKSFSFRGYRLELDSTEIIADDPGAGTPALVISPRGNSGTYTAIDNEGEFCDGEKIPPDVLEWLGTKRDIVDSFINEHS